MKHLNKDQIASYLQLSSDESEEEEFEDAQEHNQESIEPYQLIWTQAEGLRSDYTPPSVDEFWLGLQNLKKERYRKRVLFPSVSGVVACLLLFVFFAFFNITSQNPTIITATDTSLLDQSLPDGSILSLMSASKVSFVSNENQRGLALIGGGFFQVKKDPEKPFIINTDKFQVEVLGTSFYVNDGTWGPPMVVVQEGLVNVRFEEHSLKITKGEVVVLDLISRTYDRLTVPNQNFLAWKTGELNFDAAPISEVIQVLESNFQTQLSFDPESRAMLTASFKDQTLENILHLIQVTLNLKIQEIDE